MRKESGRVTQLGSVVGRAGRMNQDSVGVVGTVSGARPDTHDPCKWHTARGVLSVCGAKFFNWHRGTGGGGAIDLVIPPSSGCLRRSTIGTTSFALVPP